MPIATALIVAAAAYAAQGAQKKDGAAGNNDEGGYGDGGTTTRSSSDPPNITFKFLENKTSIELLPLEQSLTMLEWPIVTVSFYECKNSLSSNSCCSNNVDNNVMNDILSKLERRVHAVLRANPWLGGWLVRGKGIGSFDLDNTPRLWYDPTGNEMAPGAFQRVSHEDVPLDEATSYTEYESILFGGGVPTSSSVKTNPEIANRKEESLFRVTAIPSSKGGSCGFALVVSMSHICGDGHTFYRILNMILEKSSIASMNPKRPSIYNQTVMNKMGKQESRYVRDIATAPGWMKLFRHGDDVNNNNNNNNNNNAEEDAGSSSSSSELCGRVFFVDRRWIGNIKASHLIEGEIESNAADVYASTLRSPMTPISISKGLEEEENVIHDEYEYDDDASKNPTQSTNDILVSFFWKLVDPDVGLMAVNFRGRLEGDDRSSGEDGHATTTTVVTEDHAGNYANPIPYTRADYESPALIRKSLETCRRAGTRQVGKHGFVASTLLPRPNPDLTFSIITNWSSFVRGRGGGAKTNEGDDDDDDDATDWCEGLGLVRHLPIIHPNRMMKKMPKRMSFLVIFSSGTEEIGCVLIAPGRVMEEIDTCGVVKELIAEF